MKFRINPSLIIAGGLAAAAAGWIYSGQLEDDPFAAQEPTAVTEEATETDPVLAESGERKIPSVRVMASSASAHRAVLLYTGRTESDRHAVLRAETDGRIVEVLAEESQTLEDGAEIVKIAVSDRPARLREANALIRQREIEFDAAKSLAGKGFQTRSAQAEAEANLSSARAMREEIRVDLARTTITAPFSGVLESRSVEVGDYVRAGDEVARIGDYDPIVVTIQVSEREIARMEEGVVADIELVSGETLPGVVSRIATTADGATRTFEVELEVPNDTNVVREGMTAKVLLPTQEVIAHRISPALLTLNDRGQVGVHTLGPANIVEFYPIEIVEDRADGMWVAGLPRKATLIVVGQAFVSAGVEVIPVELSPEEVPSSLLAPAISVGDDADAAEGERS